MARVQSQALRLDVDFSDHEGALLAEGRYTWESTPVQSGVGWIPSEARVITAEVYARPADGNPSVDVRILQGVRRTALVDREVPVPSSLATLTAEARELISDEVVGNYVQFEVSVSGGAAYLDVVVCAR